MQFVGFATFYFLLLNVGLKWPLSTFQLFLRVCVCVWLNFPAVLFGGGNWWILLIKCTRELSHFHLWINLIMELNSFLVVSLKKKKKGGGGGRLFPVFHIQCPVQTGSDSEAPSQMHLIQCQNSSHEFENNTGVTNLCMLVSPICQS